MVVIHTLPGRVQMVGLDYTMKPPIQDTWKSGHLYKLDIMLVPNSHTHMNDILGQPSIIRTPR